MPPVKPKEIASIATSRHGIRSARGVHVTLLHPLKSMLDIEDHSIAMENLFWMPQYKGGYSSLKF